LKIKLFVVLWITLFTVVGLGSFFYSSFQQRERLDMVDNQLNNHMRLIADSDFASMSSFVPVEADEKLQDILGGYRVGLFMIIRDDQGKILYMNHNAASMDIVPKLIEGEETVDAGQHLLRVRTLAVGPNRDMPEKRFIQLGQVFSKNFLRNMPLSPFYYIIFPTWFFMSMALAFLLSSYLFRPIKKLSHELDYLSSHLEVDFLEKAIARMDERPHLFAELTKDEFYELRASFVSLLRQFVKSLQHNISMEGYLVHEINTPLTVARNKIEEIERARGFNMGEVKDILSNLAKFAQDFLSWASLQYIPVENTQVFAIDVAEFARKMIADLQPIYGDRVRLEVKAHPRAFASLSDMEHILQNLLVNALKYSSGPVTTVVGEECVSIEDEGPGLSAQVRESLGKPFNYGPHTPSSGKSTGMGLALVHAVAGRYDWKLSFESRAPRGLNATIHFNS